jgi:hypothetical protein
LNKPKGVENMTTKKVDTQKNDSKEALFTIEELKTKHKVKHSIFTGLKAHKRWAEGKKVSEKDFLKAVQEFLGAPIDNKVVKK